MDYGSFITETIPNSESPKLPLPRKFKPVMLPPYNTQGTRRWGRIRTYASRHVDQVGFEPTTFSLQKSCSTVGATGPCDLNAGDGAAIPGNRSSATATLFRPFAYHY